MLRARCSRRARAVCVGVITSMVAVVCASTAGAQAVARVPPAAGQQPAAVDSMSPAGIVNLLVSRHIAGTMGFDTTAVAAMRRWLAAGLLARLERYFARPVKSDALPAIDFDPFIDAQDYPTKFSVATPRTAGDRVSVPVRFADGITHYTVTYVLHLERGAWRITDIRGRSGLSLMRLLQ